jgi:transposase
MKAYSEDLRTRVVDAVAQGYPRTEIVKLLGVSLATIKRYLKQHRQTGHVKAKIIPGRTPKKLAALQVGITDQLRAHPDVSLERHCELWEQTHGLQVSRWTMSEAIRRVQWTRKKSLWQPRNATRRNEPAGASR